MCSIRPGSQEVQGVKPSNRSSEMRHLNKISPIQRNIGRATRAHSVDVDQIDVAMTSANGTDANETMVTSEIAISAKETQRPLASNASKSVMIMPPAMN